MHGKHIGLIAEVEYAFTYIYAFTCIYMRYVNNLKDQSSLHAVDELQTRLTYGTVPQALLHITR